MTAGMLGGCAPVIASEAKQSPSRELEIASSQSFDSASLHSGSLLAMTQADAEIASSHPAEEHGASKLLLAMTQADAEIASSHPAEERGASKLPLAMTHSPIVGTVTSGGTESILLAMKTYRDWAREKRGITRPEMIAPVTAHAAFDKAAQYFGIKRVEIPLDAQMRADVNAARRAITRNTIVIVGSAPSFPHGVVDPIKELSELAGTRGIGFHTDACLGGFLLPWAEKLGYNVPAFDFRLPGVTSISVDTHKYGYAPKGTSVVLYRSEELRRFQYFMIADWPGGLYCSPTFAGSRPGALIAACWATLIAMGEAGYLDAARRILETTRRVRQAIAAMDDLELVGDSLFVVAFASKTLDVYKIADAMGARHWSLNALHKPPALHLAITLRHTQPGVDERFVEDLRAAVASVRANPSARGEMAPVYGLAATLPFRGVVNEMLKRYLDLLYRVE
jgi:glutamate/tyrosine decarboxylase-like PLP-dependent enzyme